MIIRSIAEVVKGRGLASVAPGDTIRAACGILNEADVSALAVMDGDALVGVVSERDVIRRAIGQGRSTEQTRVDQIMTTRPTTVDNSVSLSDAMRAMLSGSFRHLPVTTDGKVTSMLSMRDIPTEYRLMVERYDEYLSSEAEALRMMI